MMRDVVLRARTVVGHDRDWSHGWVGIRDGVFTAIGDGDAVAGLDLGDAIIIPGLIDLHIHGRAGHDVMDAGTAALAGISAALVPHGVTGFLATTATAEWSHTLRALSAIADAMETGLPGARLFGAYSEGLFFCCKHRGAHNPAFLLAPTEDRITAMHAAARGTLKVLALAPEIDGAMAALRRARALGIDVAIGHTDATYEQTCAALSAGARSGVHLFNGMRGIHHREPGCAGALLLEDCLVEVIADGAHLHGAILELITRVKRSDQILLISDCMCAGGLTDGRYRLAENDVWVNDGVALTGEGGLAGSTIALDRAIAVFAERTDVPFRDVVHMASRNPAQFLGIDDRFGSIAPGKQADFAILSNDRQVLATVIGGRVVYCAPAFDRGRELAHAFQSAPE